MYNMKTLLTLISIISFDIYSQKIDQMVSYRNIDSDRYARIIYDNDYFSETDRDYSQGYSLEVAHPFLSNNPINNIFYKKNHSSKKYGLLWEHIGFTPVNIESIELQIGDRPFASAFMLKSYLIDTDSSNRVRLSSSLNIGAIGPVAFGKEMQTGIHKAIDYTIPGGWKHQIKNDVVINYGLDIEKQVYRYKNVFNLMASARGKLGTLYTNLSAGFNMTIGKSKSVFFTSKKSNFQLYLFANPIINAIGYDATLQGGLFNRTSTYTIPSENIERITYEVSYGVVIQTKSLFIEYFRAEMSKERKNGPNIGWGGLKIGFKI